MIAVTRENDPLSRLWVVATSSHAVYYWYYSIGQASRVYEKLQCNKRVPSLSSASLD